MAEPQEWEIEVEGRRHRLTASPSSWSRTLEWRIDDEVVAMRKTSDDRVQLAHEGLALDVRFSALGAGRRATLHADEGDGTAELKAGVGVGGVDLVPAPGSPAAKREQWILDHPRLHTLRATIRGTAAIVVPLLLAALLARLAFSFDLPDIPWPDLPSIPWPDLPDIPWPDLPSIPLPDWSLPGWVREVLDVLRFLFPVLLAVAIARAEIRRHRKQNELRRRPDESDGGDAGDSP